VLAYSAGSALLGSARGDSVWLFGLDGTLSACSTGHAGVTNGGHGAAKSGTDCRCRHDGRPVHVRLADLRAHRRWKLRPHPRGYFVPFRFRVEICERMAGRRRGASLFRMRLA
jgi:hypothetical protein